MTCSGLYTALITPFKEDGSFDEEGFCINLAHQQQAGVKGVVIAATTGEGPSLTIQEKEKMIALACAHVTCETLVACGESSTQKTIDNLRWAKQLGATGALVVSPCYYKPTQEGLFRHYEACARSTDLPIIAYNIPGRTAVNMEVETLLRIAELPSVIGVKEASGNLIQITALIAAIKERHPSFKVFAGDDLLALPILSLGGNGVICSFSNLMPGKMNALVEACLSEDFKRARELHYELLPLLQACALETNPIPIKAAMNAYSLPAGAPRLPLTPLSASNRSKLLQVLAKQEHVHG